MTKQFRFLDWPIYVDSRLLFVEINKLSETLPKEHRYEITSQLLRAALSISLNIAEGSGKLSDKELGRYLNISLGSLYETLACLDILKSIELIDEKTFQHLEIRLSELAKQIGGFKKSLE